jgi:UDP-2,3-diacylglucosamine pyrophosphatase LpxH
VGFTCTGFSEQELDFPFIRRSSRRACFEDVNAQEPLRRPVDLLVLSDVHLGTYGCHAEELLDYLRSIAPKTVVLNGDIIDIWQFRKRYFPPAHMHVLAELLAWVDRGIPVFYLTGNHDELLRRFSGLSLGSFHLRDKLVLELPEGRAWFFHGDVFDVTMQYSKWLARLGGAGYDALILINRSVNGVLAALGRERISLSRRVKDGVKSAVRFIADFERLAAELAIEKGFTHVVCGHIHQPTIRTHRNAAGEVTYLNSGDWVENLTSLEYTGGRWTVHRHVPLGAPPVLAELPPSTRDLLARFLHGEWDAPVRFEV